MDVPKALYIVEDEPGKGDDHEDDEGDGDKQHRGTIDAWVRERSVAAHRHLHHHTCAIVHQARYLLPLFPADQHRD